jgi:hypothetical protein
LDDFNRGGPQLGCDWDARQGSWSIVTNRIRESGTAGALVIARRYAANMSFRISVDSPPNVPANAVYRVIANYLNDDNYHFGEFEFTQQELIIRLCRRTAGSNSQLLERRWDVNLVGSPQAFNVCFTDKVFSAHQSYPPYEAWVVDPSPITGGYGCGLGNGKNNIPIEYDNFYLEEHYDTNPSCNMCVCRCCDVPLPMSLTATCSFVGALGQCKETTVSLEARVPSLDWEGGRTWYGEATVDTSECNEALDPFTMKVVFYCGGCSNGKPHQWYAKVWTPSYLGEGEGYQVPDSGCCDPFSVNFKFLLWHAGGDCVGQSMTGTDLEMEVTL